MPNAPATLGISRQQYYQWEQRVQEQEQKEQLRQLLQHWKLQDQSPRWPSARSKKNPK